MPRCKALVSKGRADERGCCRNVKDGDYCFSHVCFECTCCLEDAVLDSNTVSLHCRHVFHVACIKKWIQYQVTDDKTCPTCRQGICPTLSRILNPPSLRALQTAEKNVRFVCTGSLMFGIWSYNVLVDLVEAAEKLIKDHQSILAAHLPLNFYPPATVLCAEAHVYQGRRPEIPIIYRNGDGRFSFITAGGIMWTLPIEVFPLIEIVSLCHVGKKAIDNFNACYRDMLDDRVAESNFLAKKHNKRSCDCA